ncbi:MAG TPA: hypothetical protein VMG12_04115 [Polyangiaceae bacterium]|nr:hypothetical protein [Polyangiaceae bacterium]
MAAIACDQRQEMATDAADPASPSVSPTAGASIASAAAAPSRAAALPARTTRGQMLGHYADTAAMRRALVAGKLAEYRAAAATVAGDDWTPSGAPDTRALADRARAAAAAAQVAPSLVEAAQALGELGGACAACHLASGAPVPPIAPDEPSDATNPRMLAHAVASDRLWAGLTLPSDESWAGGIQLLLQDPRLTDESAEGMSAARLLLELARRGEGAEPDQRGQLMADISLTCSGCHERLGVVLVDGVVAR